MLTRGIRKEFIFIFLFEVFKRIRPWKGTGRKKDILKVRKYFIL